MAEKTLQIIYSERSIADSINIKNFILVKFTQKEVDNFYKMIETFEKVVSVFPELYPKSVKGENIHRAVLSKQLSVFYIILNDEISVIAMVDNRMDYDKWPL
jgi:hypothetical protein